MEFSEGTLIDFLFVDTETGERFFVEYEFGLDGYYYEELLVKAYRTARDFFEAPAYLGWHDNETASLLGYDTH